jgi:DNA-nicking Smr family endonuclease
MTRRLKPGERELWQTVARTAQPLHPELLHKPDQHDKPKPKKAKPPLAPFRLGERAISPRTALSLVPSISDQLAKHPIRMDAGMHRKMSQGKRAPEARIDLHGMTLAEAQPELIRFILNAHAAGLRLVLVITGKGKRADDHGPVPVRMGVLRHQVPQWLSRPPLGPAVLQVAAAHIKHGGEGAYYVYLRRAG